MAAAIIVEDGTGVANANSYATAQQVRDYAELRGFVLSDNDALLIPFIIAAADYLEMLAPNYMGRKVFQDGMQWPRTSIFAWGWCNSFYLTGISIPVPLIKAQCQLVVEQLKGITISVATAGNVVTNSYASPLANGEEIGQADGRFTKRERLEGVTDTEYSETINTGTLPYLPAVDALLGPILISTSGQLRVSR